MAKHNVIELISMGKTKLKIDASAVVIIEDDSVAVVVVTNEVILAAADAIRRAAGVKRVLSRRRQSGDMGLNC